MTYTLTTFIHIKISKILYKIFFSEKPRMQDLEKYIPQEEAAYACHLCPKRFLKENSLRKHCILIHSSHYNCPFCEVSFGLGKEHAVKNHF